MVVRVYNGVTKHCYIQNIKALGFMGSETKMFYVFPIVSLWELITHGCSQFGPNGIHVCRVQLNIVTY